MYIATPKQDTAHVVEHTFLLCKPDAEQYHRYILQTVSDAGFQVLAKCFIITPTLAEEIASTFQSVRHCMHADHGVEKLFSQGRTGVPGDQQSHSAKRREAGDGGGSGTNMAGLGQHGGDSGAKGSGTIIKRHRNHLESHQSIMAEILRLTSRHGNTEDGVNAGLPDATGGVPDAVTTDADVRGTPAVASAGGGAGVGGEMNREHKPDRRVATAAVLKNTMLESLSYQDLLNEHVQHLAFGGTCLAVELSRQNAVERLLEIVGPENPIDARRVAPSSIRARIGRDLIRNAVHAASNLTEASHCISAVFGFATQYSAADMRAQAVLTEPGGNKSDAPVSGTTSVVRPHWTLVSVPQRGVHRGPLTPASALRIEGTNPEAHVSYYTGELSSGEGAGNAGAAGTRAAGRTTPQEGAAWQKKAEDLELQLAEERTELATNVKLLRARELDLLLREHALEKATQGIFAPPQPVPQNQQHQVERRSLSGISTLSVEGQVAQTGFLQSIIPGQQLLGIPGGLGDMPPRRALPVPQQFSQRRLSSGIAAHVTSGAAPVIEAEDVSLLLSRSVRLRALYAALARRAESGELMREDVVALYDRSPAIQLFWLENHRDFFQRHVEQHAEEPVSFDSFVKILMFLLKQ